MASPFEILPSSSAETYNNLWVETCKLQLFLFMGMETQKKGKYKKAEIVSTFSLMSQSDPMYLTSKHPFQ